MKFVILALLLALPNLSQAEQLGSPFSPAVDKRFDKLENDNLERINIARKYAKAVYDVAVDGGSSTSHGLGVTLPAGAIITSLYVYINTAFTDSGSGSVALQCAGTRDLVAWNDFTAYGANTMIARVFNATSFGTSGSIVNTEATALHTGSGASVPTACEVTAVVRSDDGYVPMTAGKMTVILDYFIR